MAADSKRELAVLRDLAKQYAELAAQPRNDERRDLWRRHNSLQLTRPLLHVRFGYWNRWCKAMLDPLLVSTDPLLRWQETWLRMRLFHATFGDDAIFEPWLTVDATRVLPNGSTWGVDQTVIPSPDPDGAAKYVHPIQELADLDKLQVAHHRIDEAATARAADRVRSAVGDIVPVVVDRSPALWHCSLSGDLGQLRSIEQVMYDMLDNPQWLHRLLAFMRDAVLTAQDEAERAGDIRLHQTYNQALPYSKELPGPAADGPAASRKQMWMFGCAQELTLISPAMHEEFMLRYQIPILAKFGLTAYGCCEDLTRKIDILRAIPNLRRIAVTPRADLRRCAEQIGTDYVMSWRPNPADHVCMSFDGDYVRRHVAEAMEMTRGQHIDIILKDVETVQGDYGRLARWCQAVRETVEKC